MSTILALALSPFMNVVPLRSMDFEVMETKEYPYSHILVIKKENEDQMIIKQINKIAAEEQVQVLAEAISGEIGHCIEISMNQIELIERNRFQNLKPIKNSPALLISFAQGQSLEESQLWPELNIGQRFRSEQSPQYKKYGDLPLSKVGLTQEVIKSMSLHPDLPAIVALDTFLGNRDRFENNIFYNPVSDQFTAIDFGESFKCPLMKYANVHLNELLKDFSEIESSQCLKGLKVYYDTLHTLNQVWPQHKIIDRLKELCEQNDFHFTNKKIELYLQVIESNFSHISNVLEALEQLIHYLEMRGL